ncbi:putative ribokinase [Martiniozyma asiatica (nom. inval.)]|nr:putative ribokinase [Martiniozyma asiatica]
MPITVIGSLNQDLVSYSNIIPGPGQTVKGESFEQHLGGKGLNECIALARLRAPSDKFSVRMWGRVGTDAAGDEFYKLLDKEGIDSSLVEKVDGSSGTAIIMVEKNSGENRILVVAGANAKLNPSADELDHFFKKSITLANLENPKVASAIHSHATKPLKNAAVAKTVDISGHQPSHMHAHGSNASLQAMSGSTADIQGSNSGGGLIYKNGSFIHDWSKSSTSNLAGGLVNRNGSFIHDHSSSTSLANKSDNGGDVHESGSFIHAHASKPPSEPIARVKSTYDDAIPSGLASHASHPKMETLTYPSPKPESLDSSKPVSSISLAAQNRLNSSKNLNDSQTSLGPRDSYLNMVAKSHLNLVTPFNKPVIDDTKQFVVLQNEFPNTTEIIHHLSKNLPEVTIFYNPSPLSKFDQSLLDALHESHYIVLNETEAFELVNKFHPTANRAPLTLLKDTSNFEPAEGVVDTVQENIVLLTKLRTLLTKPNIIITLGGNGVIYSEAGKFSYGYVPAEELEEDEIVDTTGCGDTFLGAFVLCIYKEQNIESAVKFANKAAGRCAMKRGATEAIPSWKDVENRGWIL